MIPTLTMRPLFAASVGFIPHIVKAQNYLEEGFWVGESYCGQGISETPEQWFREASSVLHGGTAVT